MSFLIQTWLLISEIRAISMGQGQEIHARKLIHQFMQTVSSFVINDLTLSRFVYISFRLKVERYVLETVTFPQL